MELLEAWSRGDADAGSRLLRRYYQPLHRFFASKLDGGIEDLIQRTLLECVKHHRGIRDKAAFRPYMFRVARNQLYSHLRQQLRDDDPSPLPSRSIADIGPSPSSLLRARDEQELLVLALRRIPLDLQIVLELHYWEQMSGTMLADALEVPLGTVKSRLRRGRQALVEALGEVEAAPNPKSTSTDLQRWASAIREIAEQDGLLDDEG